MKNVATRNKGMVNGRNNEAAVNAVIARILDREIGWSARYERTGVVVDKAARKPDIIVDVDGRTVIVECEFQPASTLFQDVEKARHHNLRGRGRPAAVVGVMLPPEAETCEDDEFEGILMSCDNLRYFVVSRDGERFPTSGYLNGSVLNVRTAIQMSSVPRELIDEGYRAAVEGIDQIVNLLTTQTNSRTLDRISSLLRQHHGPFTWKMAAIVLLNAQTFHEELAKSRHDVVTAETMRVGGIITQEQILAAWRRVLDIDYAPIFETAAEILASIPAQTAGDIIRVITKTTSRILATKAHKFGDFYGMLYQKQLYHRKHVAAFYTKPPAAVLLVNLTMRGCEDDAWRDLDAIRNMRVADFACGSGSLLTAAYTHMIHCSRASLAVIHADIMQNCLWGADIFPIATHFAVSSLSSLFSSEAFDDCHIYTRLLKADTAGFHLGSLDLIEQTAQFVVVGERHGGHGVRSVQEATLQDRSCDYIVMNPPFARATNHGGDRPDPVPPFALPGNSPDTQRAMGRHNSRLFVGTCAHGHAGLASYFMAICNKKLRGGGGASALFCRAPLCREKAGQR